MKKEKKQSRRAVFLDRDGTINKLVYYEDHGVVDSPFLATQLKLIPGAARAISILRKKGFFLAIISNQPGVAKGNMSKKEFDKISKKLHSLLAKEGARVDAAYYCPHHPNAKLAAFRKKCNCRKPEPGMLLRAASEHRLDIRRSYMVGDGINDVKAGRKAGCKTVFVGHFKPELWGYFKGGKRPDIIAKSLLEAARKMK